MTRMFFDYLRGEQLRLDEALAIERASELPDHDRITCLSRQRAIVDDQFARWARDLSLEPTA